MPWKWKNRGTNPPPALLILVKSNVVNFDHRKAIRETWASTSGKAEADLPFETVFLVGMKESATIMTKESPPLAIKCTSPKHFPPLPCIQADRLQMKAVTMVTC